MRVDHHHHHHHRKNLALTSDLIKLGRQHPEIRRDIEAILAHHSLKGEGAGRRLRERTAASHVVGTSRLTAGLRRRINQELSRHGLDGQGRFRGVGQALAEIWDILGDFGICLLNGMFDSHAYAGFGAAASPSRQHTEILCKVIDPQGDESLEITNARLVIQWYDFEESGRTEVLAYIS